MRDRLIDIVNSALKEQFENVPIGKVMAVADSLLANGVIVPPCKVGDTVYATILGEIEAFVVLSIELAYTAKGFEGEFVSNNGKYPMLFSFENIGKTVFLTREEAERALRKEDEWK